MARSIDPRQSMIARVISEFDWHNYGLDEVEEIEPDAVDGQPFADYAWDLAEQIVRKLGVTE